MPVVLWHGVLGFLAAVLSVLIFHQGTLQFLYLLGLTSSAAYNLSPVGPLHVPRLVSLCFWGGVYGAVLGVLSPRLAMPPWLSGLILGIIAALIGMFLVAWIRGTPIANNGMPWPIARSLLVNAVWGVGTGLILMVILPRNGWLFPAAAR